MKRGPQLLHPTRFGWVYLGFVMLSLLGCINYQLSLGYLLCFLLASVWLVCLVEAASCRSSRRRFMPLMLSLQASPPCWKFRCPTI